MINAKNKNVFDDIELVSSLESSHSYMQELWKTKSVTIKQRKFWIRSMA